MNVLRLKNLRRQITRGEGSNRGDIKYQYIQPKAGYSRLTKIRVQRMAEGRETRAQRRERVERCETWGKPGADLSRDGEGAPLIVCAPCQYNTYVACCAATNGASLHIEAYQALHAVLACIVYSRVIPESDSASPQSCVTHVYRNDDPRATRIVRYLYRIAN